MMALYGPRSSMTKNKTCSVIGLAFTGSTISSRVKVVALLKPDSKHATEFSVSIESFICLKAGNCNKSVALPGSTKTLCTSKSLIQRVSTKAS